MNHRILLIWDRVGDYHFARYSHLTKRLKNSTIYLAELGKHDGLYSWKLKDEDQQTVNSFSNKNVHEADFFNRIRSFRRFVKTHKIDTVVISGYGKKEYLYFIVLSKFLGIKVYLFAESWYKSGMIKDIFKSSFLKIFVKGLFVSGERAYLHFNEYLGLTSKKIVTGYSSIDNQHFSSPSNQNLPTSVATPYILTVARYSQEKNLKLLIRSFSKSALSDHYQLVIVGDGPDRELLNDLIKNLRSQVVLTDWKSYDDLPVWYQNASAFVLPSTFEPWGLVVNEAMAAGNYIMISTECGCYPDFVKDGYGAGFDPEIEESLLNTLNNFANLSELELNKQSQLGKSIIKTYDLEKWAVNFETLIN